MLAFALTMVLSAAPVPRALPQADLAIYAPRIDRLNEVTPFLVKAGTWSTVMRPESWRGEVHPLMSLDVTRPESLAEAGIDPAGSMTLSYYGSAKVTCTTLKVPKAFREKAHVRLESLGQPWTGKAAGAELVGVTFEKKVISGYAIKGNEACAVQSNSMNNEKLLGEAAKLLYTPTTGPAWKTAASLQGALFVVSRSVVAGLRGSGTQLLVDGKALGLPLPSMKGPGATPYSNTSSGLALVRARLDASGLAAALRQARMQLAAVCSPCEPQPLETATEGLRKVLTGNVLMRVDGVKVRESLRTTSAQYFAVKQAFLAELSKPGAAKSVLDTMASWSMARRTDDGVALTVRGGEVLVGSFGSHFYMANDAEALRAARAAVAGSPDRMIHGADWVVDGKKVAAGLGQIPMLDIMGSNELAGLFAAGAELGPLLAASEQLDGWMDSAAGGDGRFALRWALPAGK